MGYLTEQEEAQLLADIRTVAASLAECDPEDRCLECHDDGSKYCTDDCQPTISAAAQRRANALRIAERHGWIRKEG